MKSNAKTQGLHQTVPQKEHMILVQLLRLIDIEYENTGVVSPETVEHVRGALAEIDNKLRGNDGNKLR